LISSPCDKLVIGRLPDSNAAYGGQRGGQPMTIRRFYFDASIGQVHGRRIGAGVPAVFLHQSPLSSAQFEAAMPALAAAGLDCIALDLPGMGMSDPAPSGATLDDFAAIVPAALTHFGLAKAHLVGHHTGASVAARIAATQPHLVDRLVLNGTALLSPEEKAFFATFKFGPTVPQADGSHLAAAWATRLKATPGWSDLAAMHRWVVEGLSRGATSWMAFPAVIGSDMAADLAKIEAPTLFFTNTGEDLYEATKRAHALRPDCQYAELIGGTHDIVDEQPAAWAETILRFLKV
jgi:pimeloyl-ACP methyl ester carboxylesterase